MSITIQERTFDMNEFVAQMKAAVKCIRVDLRKMTAKEAVGIMAADVINVVGYSIIGAVFASTYRMVKLDNIVMLWLSTVVLAYLIHKTKELKLQQTNRGTGYTGKSLIGLVSLVVLVLSFFRFKRIESNYFDVRRNPFEEIDYRQFVEAFWDLIINYVPRTTGQVALYLIYFRIFGVVSSAKKKTQMLKALEDTCGKKES